MARQVITDTSFIITCVRQKIDFIEDLRFMGLEIIIPKEVFDELAKVAKNNKKRHIRLTAEISLEILKKSQESYQKISLEEYNGSYVDELIRDFAEKNTNVAIAVLDKEIKKKTLNPKIVIKRRKKLELV